MLKKFLSKLEEATPYCELKEWKGRFGKALLISILAYIPVTKLLSFLPEQIETDGSLFPLQNLFQKFPAIIIACNKSTK